MRFDEEIGKNAGAGTIPIFEESLACEKRRRSSSPVTISNLSPTRVKMA
jgi:hypothetical protein